MEESAYERVIKSEMNKLEVINCGVLRNLLNSVRSTPLEIIHVELGLEPIVFRSEWLKAKYVINMGK